MELRAILDGTWATKSTLTLPGKSEIKSWMAQRPILDLAKIHLTKKEEKKKEKNKRIFYFPCRLEPVIITIRVVPPRN